MSERPYWAELEAQTKAENIADACLTPIEAAEADQQDMNAREYVEAKYDVDPAQFDSEHALNAAMSNRQQEAIASEPDGAAVSLQARSGRETEEIADAVLTPIEAAKAEEQGVSASQMVREKHDVDPSNYGNERDLNRAISQRIQAGK
jgi:hypothetical protein